MEYEEISPSDAFIRMRDNDALYLDVRTEEEFSAGRPKGAVNVPVLTNKDGVMVPNPNFVDQVEKLFSQEQELLVGCKTGGRSTKACDLLVQAGFIEITNVTGGYDGTPYSKGWSSSDLPIETS